MKGKIGLVVGLGVGYVLGTRAGRERYEQIKTQWLKVWHLDPVQAQVTKVSEFAKSQAAAVPSALWNGAVKVIRSVGGESTPGEKLDSALATGKKAAADVADTVKEAASDASESVKKATPAAKKAPAAKAPAKKPTQSEK